MEEKGYMYIAATGFDPEHGRDLEDPYLNDTPTLGACMPNIREQVVQGDHIFVVSGKVQQASQLVLGGFEVAEKLDSMLDAYARFPALRLHEGIDGLKRGNIVILPDGRQHPLDRHNPETFQRRIKNYVVGRNLIALKSHEEITLGRKETLPVLREVLGKEGASPIKVIGRWSKLDKGQIITIRDWLEDLKIRADLGRVA